MLNEEAEGQALNWRIKRESCRPWRNALPALLANPSNSSVAFISGQLSSQDCPGIC